MAMRSPVHPFRETLSGDTYLLSNEGLSSDQELNNLYQLISRLLVEESIEQKET